MPRNTGRSGTVYGVRLTDEAGNGLDASVSVEADGERFAVVVDGGDARAVRLVLWRLSGYEAVLHVAGVAVRLGERPDFAVLAERFGALPVRLVVDVPGAEAGRLESDLARRVAQVDRRFGVDDLMATLGKLNRYQGTSLHKPLSLIWAFGQIAAGRDRWFRWPEFRAEVRSLLADFGAGAKQTPQYPFWHLRSESDLWETRGLTGEPKVGDVDALAGFTLPAAELLADPGVRTQAVDVLRVAYLADVDIDQGGLLRRVGLPVPTAPSAADVLQVLVGKEIKTVTGFANQVVALDPVNVLVRTAQSTEAKPVPVREVQDGLDRLFAKGRVRADVDSLGYRSAFVAAVLATLPRAKATKAPATVSLGHAPTAPVAADPEFGELDRRASAKYRVEQNTLRRMLIGDQPTGRCALCDRELPVDLLIAAHVKRRSECSDEERRDWRNVVMLACSLGCDRLYELGYVSVGPDGEVLTVTAEGALAAQLGLLAGLRSRAHHDRSAGYFAWHRTEVFKT